MNNISSEQVKNEIFYTLKGPLNMTLRNKAKNKTHKMFRNFDKLRNLSKLRVSINTSDETQDLLNRVKSIKPDIKLPCVVITLVNNLLYTNILDNSARGTFINTKKKNKYFGNIGSKISFGSKSGYFLRKGAGKILISYALNDLRKQGVKTVLIQPLNKKLEKYYTEFGFISIPCVPYNIDNPKRCYGRGDDGNVMYLEL